jgi:hypothetical protein
MLSGINPLGRPYRSAKERGLLGELSCACCVYILSIIKNDCCSYEKGLLIYFNHTQNAYALKY